MLLQLGLGGQAGPRQGPRLRELTHDELRTLPAETPTRLLPTGCSSPHPSPLQQHRRRNYVSSRERSPRNPGFRAFLWGQSLSHGPLGVGCRPPNQPRTHISSLGPHCLLSVRGVHCHPHRHGHRPPTLSDPVGDGGRAAPQDADAWCASLLGDGGRHACALTGGAHLPWDSPQRTRTRHPRHPSFPTPRNLGHKNACSQNQTEPSPDFTWTAKKDRPG